MDCRAITKNGFHYIRFNNNNYYVYSGVEPNTPPEEIVINQNFFITLIDEADPAYAYDNGTTVGQLWSTDVSTFNNLNINPNAVIIFDIANRINQIGQTILPNNGLGSPSPVPNIIATDRPTINDPISQNALYLSIKNTIENVWGSNFWSRFAASGYKLIIIIDNSGSLNREIIADGITYLEDFLDSENIPYQEFVSCSNERWLNWISMVYSDPNIDNIDICSCISGTYCEPDFRWQFDNNRCLIDSIYYDTTKVYEYATTDIMPLHRWAGDTTNYGGVNINPLIEDKVFISKKIKIVVDDPIFGGTYVFDKGVFGSENPNYQQSDFSNWCLNLVESDININKYQDSLSSGTELSYHNRYCIEFYAVEQTIDGGVTTLGGYSTSKYPGYLETKIKESGYYDDIYYIHTAELEDAFAFPCHFVFVAVQPPVDTEGAYQNDVARILDLTASNTTSEIMPTGIGYRFVAGFSMPLEYRYVYGDWRLVNEAVHNVSGIPVNYYITSDRDTYYLSPAGPNYPDGRLFNSLFMTIAGMPGTQTDSPDVINHTYSYYFTSTTYNNSNGTIQYPGFAFRASGIGIPYDGSYSRLSDSLKPQNEFRKSSSWASPSYDNYWEVPYYDTRSLFAKTPSKASIEFVDGCEYVKCQTIANNNNISTTEYDLEETVFSGCYDAFLNGSTIQSSYVCQPGSGTPSPDQEFFDSLNINTYQIMYSGFISEDQAYGVYASIYDNNDNLINVYKPNLANSQTINIPYTGPANVGNVTNYISQNINLVKINLSANIIIDKIKYIDIIWNIDGTTAKALIIPNLMQKPNSIEIIGAGTAGANGIYEYSYEYDKYINQNSGSGDWQIIFIPDPVINHSGIWHIAYNEVEGVDCPQSYYSINGLIDIIPINSSFVAYKYGLSEYTLLLNNNAWTNEGLAGLPEVPTSHIYPNIYGSGMLPVVSGDNDYPITSP